MDIVKAPQLTAAGARRAVDLAVEKATEFGVSVVVAVADAGGNPLALHRMDGAPLFSVTVAEKKAWTAVAGGARTCDLRAAFNGDPTLLHALAPKVDALMAVGGAAPVMVEGSVAGAIGVSGATEEQDQDCADWAATNLG